MDERDALLKRALDDLYWWGHEHGCCVGATEETERAIRSHLTSVGVPVETFEEWEARKRRELDEELAAAKAKREAALPRGTVVGPITVSGTLQTHKEGA